MDLGLGKDRQEALGEEAGKEIKGVAKSAWNGFDAGATQFSEGIEEVNNWAGEHILGLKFDRPDEHGVTYRDIAEKDKQRAVDHVSELEADAPYKDIFNATKNTVNKGLDFTAILMGVRSLPALAKVGFAKIKDLNMALKLLGIDTKFIDQELEVVENCSKKFAGKLSKEAEELSEAIKKLFGDRAGKADNVITEADRIKQFNLNNCRGQMKDALSKFRNELLNNSDAKDISKICSTADLGDLNLKGEAGSGIWKYNPTIKDYTGADPREFCKTTEDYTKYYRSLLSDEYLESLPDSFWAGKK